MTTTVYAGRFDFEDGGTYCGGWEDGKAHGHGVCTGPKSMGEFSGMWQFGYEVSGVYIWPSGNFYMGQWMSGKRHGLGVEKKQRWIYKGEWSQGFKGRYGVRISEASGAKYEGTWANGLQDGYGSETYADGGTYFGQMSQGMRNGYGIRKSVSYGVASRYRSKDVKDSLTSLRSEEGDERVQRERDRRFDENRGGFVLRARSDLTDEVAAGITGGQSSTMNTTAGNIMTNALNGLLRRRRNSFGQSQDRRVSLRKTIMSKLKKQKSAGDIDEVNAVGGGGGAHTAITNNPTSSSGRAHKKSSFRSTSSNNSVDSRTSNRTAPAGIGLNSPSLGGLHNTTAISANQDDGEHSFISQDEITDANCIEVYMGEWKQDKRTGYGIAERSDGLKYEGEWFNNKKNGYGVTTFKDGTKEEGKYKNNVLATDKKKAKILLLRSNKIRQKIDAAVNAALKAGQIAQQRADIALARAVNARTKSHAAELAGKQARADSEYARMKARDVAPDFVQPGENKLPELILDIDRMNTYAPHPPLLTGIADPVAFNNISPNQFNKMQQPLNIQLKQETFMSQNAMDNYMSWQQQQHQQQQQANFNTPHSSTPPPMLRTSQHQPTPTRTFSPNTSQYYDTNLITPQQQQQHQHQLQQQHSMDFPINNLISSNQLLMQQNTQQQLHPSIDPTTGQKLNNDLLGLDAQTLSQYQMHPNFMQQQFNPALTNPNTSSHHQLANKHMLQQNYSFEDQLPNNYFDGGINHRLNLLQQAQSHSFNMDMLSGVGSPNQQQLDLLHQQQYFQNQNNAAAVAAFQRNNPKRNTLRRSQRVMDSSADDLNGVIGADLAGLSPQQQQQILMMRNQQYSNNSSGQESGIGTGSSVYTNATNSAHGTHDILHNNTNSNAQHPHHPHHHHHRPSHHPNNSNISPQGRPNDLNMNQLNQNEQSINQTAQANNSTNEDYLKAPPQIPRRKSLPSIVKTKSFKEDDTAHSSSELNDKNQETFIIENGIRKRVTEKANSAINQKKLGEDANATAKTSNYQTSNDHANPEENLDNLEKRRTYEYEDDQTPQLPRKIIIESITSLNSPSSSLPNSKRVSMPSIPAYLSPRFANKVMSREEANRLSSLRREELRKNRELENNRTLRIKNMLKNDTISMFFKTTSDSSIQTDEEEYSSWIKDVFLRNRLFLFIILFNMSLAIWFLQMLK